MHSVTKILLVCLTGTAYARSITTQEKIIKELLTDYDSQVSPHDADSGNKFAVNVTFQVMGAHEIEDSHGDMRIRGLLSMSWQDDRLQYKDSNALNLQYVRVDPENIWTPDINLFNWAASVDNVGLFRDSKDEFPAMITPQGSVLWVPPVVVVVVCDRSNFTNAMTCPLKFGSWTYSMNQFDIQTTQTKFDDYYRSNQWKYTNGQVKLVKEKFQDYPEDYSHLLFEFSFEKKPKQKYTKKPEATV